MEKTSTLREGSTLRGKGYVYHIEHVLGQGSFGITYLATTKVSVKGELGNIETEIRVAIKEFYMHEFCSRHEDGTIAEMTQGTLVANYARKFRKEAENLAKLSHPNIVKVLEVFDANNTTYYAMEYIPGGSLDAYVKQQGGLPEDEAIACIRQIGSALGYMHDHKMLHLDLKPSNVMRSSDGSKLTLIDFGLSKQYEENGNPESSTSIGLGTPGYAPIEQSSSDRDKDFAPTLDVYALGATFFKLLTGDTPPKASDVLNEGLPVQLLESKGVSPKSIEALEQAMEPRKPKRLKTVSSFLSLLNGDVTQFDWVELSPSSLDLEEGMTRLLTVRVSSEEDRKRLRWQSLSPSVAIVDGSGRVTAVGVGTALICVTCGTAVAQCELTVYARHKPPVPKKWLYGVVGAIIAAVVVVLAIGKGNQDIAVESISVTPSELSLKEGESKKLSVEFTPENATDKSVVWISSDNNVAKVDNTTGDVTALKAGKATITAACGGKQSACAVTVTAVRKVVPVESITLSRSSLALEEGGTATLTVKYTPSDATETKTDWESTDPQVVTVSKTGKVTAISAGSASVRVACGGKTAYCNVTVSGKKTQPASQASSLSSSSPSSKTFTVNGVSFMMVSVQGGTFQMGATSEQGSDAYSDESPVHSVTLSSYKIGETEVTQALWTAVMGSNPSNWKGDNLPVEYVSWDDCQTFIRKLNSLTGQNFRLPTEAEWEYAARGGNKSNHTKYSGSSSIDNVAWYDGNSGSKTHAVKSKQPNELGLYDMSGNVYEWCQDWYGSYSSSSQTNPVGAASGSHRVNRGGSWYFNAGYCRVSNRNYDSPDYSDRGLGLRLAL